MKHFLSSRIDNSTFGLLALRVVAVRFCVSVHGAAHQGICERLSEPNKVVNWL